jgi:hypothetical protein
MNHSQTSNGCSVIRLTLTSVVSLLLAACSSLRAEPNNDNRAPDVPTAIQTPGTTNKVHFHAYAVGVQIYDWNGTAWVFRAPEAVLLDADGNPVGIHYAGPTWETESGSKVVGARVASAPSSSSNSIPQLLLKAVSSEGPGVLKGTTYIQPVNTVGGVAPGNPGTIVGEEARVAYLAEYFFYREQK